MNRMSRADRELWAAASTLEDLARLTARWLEGDLASQPGYQPDYGPDDETDALIPTLARVNRAGFLTECSQPGYGNVVSHDGAIWDQRAAVAGRIAPESAERLVTAAEAAGLIVITYTTPRRFASRWSGWIDVTMRNGKCQTGFGIRQRRRDIEFHFQECSDAAIAAVIGAVQITIADPEYGPHDRLWSFLDEWANTTTDLRKEARS